MDTQLQQIINVQAEQKQLLKSQVRWLKFSLLMLVLLATAWSYCLGFLIHERSTTNSKSIVVTTEPLLEHPISLAGNDTIQFQLPATSLAENDTTQFQFGKRITVPPMEKAEFAITAIKFYFPEPDQRRGFNGMCL